MKTLVVKIGTSTLVRNGAVDEEYIGELARQVAILRGEGRQVVVVSSGAIRLGLDTIGREKATKLAEKQAAAAIGQSLLMRAYRRAFSRENLHVAQILLTRAELGERRAFLNARHTFSQLFEWGVVPIVNENDTVSTEEIRFGDNDTLAALTALVAGADGVLLLSDVDGFYLPGELKPVPQIAEVTPEIEAAAGGAGSVGGTGGMKTKLEAAKIATRAGVEMVIAQGRAPEIVLQIARGEGVGTHFLPQSPEKARKSWILHGRRVEGTLFLNSCARAALVERGSSLLPVGIERVEGDFSAGALVSIRDEQGEMARGLAFFSASELRRIAGRHSREIAEILGRAGEVAVHRNNLTLLGPSASSMQPEALRGV